METFTNIIIGIVLISIFPAGFFYLDWWMTKKSKESPKKKEG